MNKCFRDFINNLKNILKKTDEKVIAIIVLGILAGIFCYTGASQELVILCIVAIAGIAGYKLTSEIRKRLKK